VALLVLIAPFAIYFLSAVALGRIPVNADWHPPEEGPTIFVLSNGVHVDLVLPARCGDRNFREALSLSDGSGLEQGAQWVAFGWGERRFYLETQKWADLKLSTALAAVFLPTPTLMHVTFLWRTPRESENCVRLKVTEEQLERLAVYVNSRFARDEGQLVPIPGEGYGHNDEFYEATGSYHAFNTCNDWANRGLAESGLRAAFWSPFDTAILEQLRRFGSGEDQ